MIRLGRLQAALAAFALAAGLVTAADASAGAAVTCPTVNPSTGAVTPAPAPGVDWAGCDLMGAALDHADLAGANLSGANLSNVPVAGANLSQANLSDATLTTLQSQQTDFAGANLAGASAIGAVLGFDDLQGAAFAGANLTGASFQSADLFQATGLLTATTTAVTWTGATCPNGASANYYTGGCVGTVSVTTPSATPVVTGGTAGTNGWYRSAVTVTWYWVDANPLVAAECPATSTSSGQGTAVPITGSCTDSDGNKGTDTVTEPIDTTPPVETITGVRDGGIYDYNEFPLPTCTVTDALSGVASNGTQALYAPVIPGTKTQDLAGVYKLSCSGAVDKAGNVAGTVSAQWTVAYMFGGFEAPKPGSTLSHAAKSITVKTFLADDFGTAIPAVQQAARAKYHQVRATLRGPGISAVTVFCSWHATGRYLQCVIPVPRKVRTGHKNVYTITVAEDLGSSWFTVPADAASQNPEPVYFK